MGCIEFIIICVGVGLCLCLCVGVGVGVGVGQCERTMKQDVFQNLTKLHDVRALFKKVIIAHNLAKK